MYTLRSKNDGSDSAVFGSIYPKSYQKRVISKLGISKRVSDFTVHDMEMFYLKPKIQIKNLLDH